MDRIKEVKNSIELLKLYGPVKNDKITTFGVAQSEDTHIYQLAGIIGR